MFRGWTEGLQNSAQENAVTTEKLWDDSSLTLKKVSEKNTQAADAATTATTAATTTAMAAQSQFNNVQDGMMMSAGSVLSDAKIIAATPQVQVPTAVTANAVNTPDDQNARINQNSEKQVAPQTPDLLSVLNAILQVMRDSLTQEVRQADLSELLLKSNRPQAMFPSADVLANKLIKG
jgi:hypothetical protein